MTNEELVALIQAGDRARLAELWGQVERFVAMQANKRLVLSGGMGGVEFGDLYDAGYIAMVAAVETFDQDAGCSFIGWLVLALKTAFAEAGGYRSKRRNPLDTAASLDAPAGESEDGATLGDLQTDPEAVQAFQDVEDGIYLDQLRTALDRALAALPERQGATLRRRYYQDQTLEEIAANEGVHKETVRQWENKGLRAIRRSKARLELEQFIEQRTPYYLRVGVQAFHSTGESATERIVFKREKMRGLL